MVDNKTSEEEAMEYVSKQEVSEAVKIKQMELEMKREIERERLGFEREERQRDREAQAYIEKKKKKKMKHFDVTKHIRFVPPFNESEIDKYCLLFGKKKYIYIPFYYKVFKR